MPAQIRLLGLRRQTNLEFPLSVSYAERLAARSQDHRQMRCLPVPAMRSWIPDSRESRGASGRDLAGVDDHEMSDRRASAASVYEDLQVRKHLMHPKTRQSSIPTILKASSPSRLELPLAECHILHPVVLAWERLRGNLDPAGREHFDRGGIPCRGEDGRWTSDRLRTIEGEDPAAAWERATRFMAAWHQYLAAYDLAWPLDEPASPEERRESGWLLTNDEESEFRRRERAAVRAASTWPGIDAAEQRYGRVSAIGEDGRPWWYSRHDMDVAWFLCRDGTTTGRHSREVLRAIRHQLRLAGDEKGLRALAVGRIPMRGVGGRLLFLRPPDPFLEPWFPHLDAIGYPLPSRNPRRWEGMWHVLRSARAELLAMQEQELDEYPEKRLHEEWMDAFEEVFDDEIGAFVAAPPEF